MCSLPACAHPLLLLQLKIRDRFLPDAPKGLAATADEDPVAKVRVQHVVVLTAVSLIVM